jgi:hypothetical protein
MIIQLFKSFHLHHLNGFFPSLGIFQFLYRYNLVRLQIHSFHYITEGSFANIFDEFVLVHIFELI